MPLVIPYAAALADDARAAFATLRLPALAALVARAGPSAARDDGDEWSLSLPHERVLARACGWSGADGRLPWAARAASDAGIATGDLAWGLLEPVHWRVGSDEVGLVDPAALELDIDESRALFEAARPLFESEGWLLMWLDTTRWLTAHESLRELATASIDRAVGRDVQRWLPRSARAFNRLHSEVQMAWHREPANEAREARGAWPVNALWLSGCGVHQPTRSTASVTTDDRLRAPALAGDWAAWADAWRALDTQAIAPALDADASVTLCGERAALTLQPQPGWWARTRAHWRRNAAVAPLLEIL
jgi:hypothetical protein